MAQDISYSIPVKSHVLKYISAFVVTDPFSVGTHNEFGTLLFMCLERKPKIIERRLELSERMVIRIQDRYARYQGVYISNKKILLFNEMVERLMKRELFAMLTEGNREKGDIKRIIFRFRDTYGITDEELEYHNLRKAYNRERGLCK